MAQNLYQRFVYSLPDQFARGTRLVTYYAVAITLTAALALTATVEASYFLLYVHGSHKVYALSRSVLRVMDF